jgi:hypothetical protein
MRLGPGVTYSGCGRTGHCGREIPVLALRATTSPRPEPRLRDVIKEPCAAEPQIPLGSAT